MTSPSDVDAAAERLERLAPGYLAQVRRAAKRLSVAPTAAGRLADALELVETTAQIDPNARITEQGTAGRSVQRVVRRLVRWYMVQVSGQVTEFSYAVAWLGFALREYIDEVDHQVQQLRAEVAELRARLPEAGR